MIHGVANVCEHIVIGPSTSLVVCS